MTEKRATPVDKEKGRRPAGVNNPMVDTFIKQVVQNTDFKFGMYLDGDSVGFKKQEMLK